MAAKIKELIQSATIARVTDKETGTFLGWCVKSNHTSEYYEVHCTKIAGDECFWTCTCVARMHGCLECCHIKAVKAVGVARKALKAARNEVAEVEVRAEVAQATVAQAEAIVVEERERARKAGTPKRVQENWGEDVHPQKRALAPLNGNRAFSFLK